MPVTVEDVSSVEKILHIEVPKDEVQKEINKAFDQLKKTAKVKGFRPGKAPRSVLERLYGKDVRADVAAQLIQESLTDAIRETSLPIIGEPRLDPPELAVDQDYRYDATVELRPELPEIDYKGLSLKKTRYAVSDEEVEAQLKMIRKNMSQLVAIEEERPVQENDVTLIDFEGLLDGRPHPAAPFTENFSIRVGEGRIEKAFDDGLIGMKKGEEKEISVAFAEDYSDTALAGKKIDFQVTVKEIKTEVLPEIDDEFAKDVGRYENLAELRAAIVSNLDQGYAKRSEQEVNEQIFSALIGKTPFEVPNMLVEAELEQIIQEAERAFSYRNMSMEDAGVTIDGLKEKYRSTAEKQVRRLLILRQIVEQEDLTVSDEDLEEGYKEVSSSYGQPVEDIKAWYNENAQRLEQLKDVMLEKRAIRLILDNSAIEEVDAAPEQDADGEAESDGQ